MVARVQWNGMDRALSILMQTNTMTRSIAVRTFGASYDLAVALRKLGYNAHPVMDSKGRPVVITNASEFALVSVES